MTDVTSPIATLPIKKWVQVVSGCALASCLGLIVTSPSRHVASNCPTNLPPTTIITSVGAASSSECLLVQSMTRKSSLWVY